MVITDRKRINELLSRGIEKIYPSREELKKVLLSGRRLRLYCGFDPSAPSLHIGNAILINKLSQFQDLGHEVIFLIGDFTGMIGDPTDKMAARKKMTRAQVRSNAKMYKEQASVYLRFFGDNPAAVRYNSEWSDKLTFKDLIEIASNFTVQQMIQRDMFQRRLKDEKPIYLHEFLYPLAQGYDSVAMDVDLEIGGNDQMFNMMAGRDLVKAINKKEKFVLTMKLLADDQGKKMGKSEGNAVFLNEPADVMYGVIMSWPDGVIGAGFELCTKVSESEVADIKKKLAAGEDNPRDFKMRLAREIVGLVHGEEKAKKAEEQFIKIFREKRTPDKMPEIKVKKEKYNIINLLLETKLVESRSEARRLISQNGIKVNEQVINNIAAEIVISKKGVILQRGKRRFARILI